MEVFTAPWYPWYANDVLMSERVELMSLAEEGAYRRALDKAWKKGSIPADPLQCARTIGKGCSVKIAEAVLRMFSPMPGDSTRMIHDTLEKVREEQRQKYLTAAAKGKAAAEKRWHSDAPAIPQALPKQCHSDTDIDSLTREETATQSETVAKKPKDPRSSHPAIQTFRKVRGRYPDKELYDRIIQRFGSSPDEKKLRDCWVEWVECGYNKNSAKWLNWYFSGIPERKAPNTVVTTVNAPRKTAADYRREADAQMEADLIG